MEVAMIPVLILCGLVGVGAIDVPVAREPGQGRAAAYLGRVSTERPSPSVIVGELVKYRPPSPGRWRKSAYPAGEERW